MIGGLAGGDQQFRAKVVVSNDHSVRSLLDVSD